MSAHKGDSWRMDETYVKVRGEWMYLYRAVDKAGKTVDFYLSRRRDVNAAKAFLRKAMKGQRVPAKVTVVLGNLILRYDRPGFRGLGMFERTALDVTRSASSADKTSCSASRARTQ